MDGVDLLHEYGHHVSKIVDIAFGCTTSGAIIRHIRETLKTYEMLSKLTEDDVAYILRHISSVVTADSVIEGTEF
jgi:hypothetical protein